MCGIITVDPPQLDQYVLAQGRYALGASPSVGAGVTAAYLPGLQAVLSDLLAGLA